MMMSLSRLWPRTHFKAWLPAVHKILQYMVQTCTVLTQCHFYLFNVSVNISYQLLSANPKYFLINKIKLF